MEFSALSLLAVFLTGLLGGLHCAGMCGGIVSALGMLQQRTTKQFANQSVGIPVRFKSVTQYAAAGPARGLHQHNGSTTGVPTALKTVSLYNLGRISTYTLLGALAGGVGSVAWLMQSVLPIQQSAFLLSNVILILMGLYIVGVKRIGAITDSLGLPVWKYIKPIATARLGRTGSFNSLLAGSLWGLVPCGMVYAVLSAALVSGSAKQGGLLMLVFGLGTLPNLMLLGLSGQWLARASRNQYIRLLAGLVIIGFGVMGLMHWSMMISDKTTQDVSALFTGYAQRLLS